MAQRFYQFDFAEMEGPIVKNLGVLNFQSATKVSKDILKEFTRQYLKNPAANIIISHVTKLNRTEFEKITGKRTG